MKDGYKLASKCGLWTDIYKKITEIKILMIALVVQPSIRCPAADRDVTMVRHCCAYNSISVRIYFIFCYAIYCIVNTSFRRLWLSTCHHDVVMQAAQFSLFFYFNYQQTKRSFIVKFNDNLGPRWRGSPRMISMGARVLFLRPHRHIYSKLLAEIDTFNYLGAV